MSALLQIGLTNAMVATAIALLAAAAGKFCRRPALGHALWLLVLLKLVTPPLIVIPITLPEQPAALAEESEQTAVALQEVTLRVEEVQPLQVMAGPVGRAEAADPPVLQLLHQEAHTALPV